MHGGITLHVNTVALLAAHHNQFNMSGNHSNLIVFHAGVDIKRKNGKSAAVCRAGHFCTNETNVHVWWFSLKLRAAQSEGPEAILLTCHIRTCLSPAFTQGCFPTCPTSKIR